MKEKIMGIVKQPLFLGMVGSVLLAIVFGVIAALSTPKTPQVVEDFCKGLERYDKEALIELVEDTPALKASIYTMPESMVNALERVLLPEKYTADCTIGTPFYSDGITAVPVVMTLYEKKEVVHVYELWFYVSEQDGEEVLTSWILPIGTTR